MHQSMIVKWKKTKLPQKIKFKKENFKSLKINNCLIKLLSNPNICEKNGYGTSTITQLWETPYKNLVEMLVL